MNYRIQNHNREVIRNAAYRAEEMKTWPSPLEERMIKFLDYHGIRYESQKIFYITADDGWIYRYYIADFYIPEADIIIEVDGKFHDKQKQHDKMRTRDIQDNYPNVAVLRYRWKDIADTKVMDNLLKSIDNRRFEHVGKH